MESKAALPGNSTLFSWPSTGPCLLTADVTEPPLPAFLSVSKVINSEFAGGVESTKERSAAHRIHEQAMNNG